MSGTINKAIAPVPTAQEVSASVVKVPLPQLHSLT
jgi:hypothetical protein